VPAAVTSPFLLCAVQRRPDYRSTEEMLSSLQNFLPQVLQRDHPQPRVASPETSSDDEHEAQTPAEETGPKRRPTKGSNEVRHAF
jgi:hypothetical protein